MSTSKERVKEGFCEYMGLEARLSGLRGLANNKGADQPALLHSLISAFVIRLLKSIISKLTIGEISMF